MVSRVAGVQVGVGVVGIAPVEGETGVVDPGTGVQRRLGALRPQIQWLLVRRRPVAHRRRRHPQEFVATHRSSHSYQQNKHIHVYLTAIMFIYRKIY